MEILQSRLEIAEKVFDWKKATFADVAKRLDASEEEVLELSDSDYISLLFMYAGNVAEVS